MKHFYLRNAAGFPVCCVATTIVQAPTSELPELIVRYARSVYNLKDAKPRVGTDTSSTGHHVYFAIPALPFDRRRHIQAAEGRLKSKKYSRTLSLPIADGNKVGPIGVKSLIVRDIADHDTSQYAREAARLWLTNAEARIVTGAPLPTTPLGGAYSIITSGRPLTTREPSPPDEGVFKVETPEQLAQVREALGAPPVPFVTGTPRTTFSSYDEELAKKEPVATNLPMGRPIEVSEDHDPFSNAIKEMEGLATFTVADREAEFNAWAAASPAEVVSEREEINAEIGQALEDQEKLDRIFANEGHPNYPNPERS